MNHRGFIVLTLLLIGCNTTGNDTESKVEVPDIGEEYGGGIVLSTHAEKFVWIISKSNQSEGIEITCINNQSRSNQSANGWQNTKNLAEGCTPKNSGSSLVWNLSLNGYDDWYIPGRELLQWIYDSQEQTGINIDNAKYWSTACLDQCFDNYFWIDFTDGSSGLSYQESTYKIRAVRKDTLNHQ